MEETNKCTATESSASGKIMALACAVEETFKRGLLYMILLRKRRTAESIVNVIAILTLPESNHSNDNRHSISK